MNAVPVDVSVIIPTYNRSGFVRACIQGLRGCGLKNLEIIVVDDGSSDDTAEVVRQTDPQTVFVQQKNSGPAAARNNGYAHSRGRYVAFLDCDDEWLPDVPGRAVELLDRHPQVDLLFADAKMGSCEHGFESWIESGGQQAFFELPHAPVDDDFRILERGPLFERMAVRNPVFIGAVIMRREAFERAGKFDPQLCGAADWHLWLRMASMFTFGYLHRPLAIYLKHPGGMSNDFDGMSREFCMTLEKLQNFPALSPAQRDHVRRRHLWHLFHYAYRAYNRGDYSTARKRFGQLLRRQPGSLRTWGYWGASLLPAGIVNWLRNRRRALRGDSPVKTVVEKPQSRAVIPG